MIEVAEGSVGGIFSIIANGISDLSSLSSLYSLTVWKETLTGYSST